MVQDGLMKYLQEGYHDDKEKVKIIIRIVFLSVAIARERDWALLELRLSQ